MQVDRELLDRLRAFHGHLGPFAMLGYRAGRLALDRLDAPSHFGITARVTCPDRTPPSCFADGIQYSTGCTLGKGNITLMASETVSVTVTVNDSGAALTIVPRREVIAQFGPWMAQADDETAALQVLAMSDEELFEPIG